MTPKLSSANLYRVSGQRQGRGGGGVEEVAECVCASNQYNHASTPDIVVVCGLTACGFS